MAKIKITSAVDELGGTYVSAWEGGQGPIVAEVDTLRQAIKYVAEHIIPGVRGPGCYQIHMPDGRAYSACHDGLDADSWVVERYADDGELIECRSALRC